MRHTKSHTANRRSHHALSTPSHVTDAKTGSTHLRHRVDMKTGIYKGKKVLDVVQRLLKSNQSLNRF
jgi:ribosomal protein L32